MGRSNWTWMGHLMLLLPSENRPALRRNSPTPRETPSTLPFAAPGSRLRRRRYPAETPGLQCSAVLKGCQSAHRERGASRTYMAARPACSSASGSVRPVATAGHKAAAKHKRRVAPKPSASFVHGTTSEGFKPPKKLTYCEMPAPHHPAIDAKCEAQQAGDQADQDALGEDQPGQAGSGDTHGPHHAHLPPASPDRRHHGVDDAQRGNREGDQGELAHAPDHAVGPGHDPAADLVGRGDSHRRAEHRRAERPGALGVDGLLLAQIAGNQGFAAAAPTSSTVTLRSVFSQKKLILSRRKSRRTSSSAAKTMAADLPARRRRPENFVIQCQPGSETTPAISYSTGLVRRVRGERA